MRDHCDRIWEIDARREGRLGSKDAELFDRHLKVCAVCSETVKRHRRLRNLATELPEPVPAELDLRRLRARVLREFELENPRPQRLRPKVAFAIAIFACMICVLVLRHRRPSLAPTASAVLPATAASVAPSRNVTFAGSVAANDGARWTQTRDGDIEHLRIEDGTLELHVRHQTPSEHFFVDLPDGRIEVRGTIFRVDVHDGSTDRIEVSEGVVSVRFRGAEEIWVSAGQTWSRPVRASTSSSVRPAASSPATSSSAHAASAHPRATSDATGSDDYASAVALLREGSYDASAIAFAAFLASHPNAAQAEDASYLEAAALARAGRSDAAALAAEHHLSAYPHSFHRKEAAILVARAARDRGDCERARAVLASWLAPPSDPDAVATLRSCAEP